MNLTLKIGSRSSALAIVQVDEVLNLLRVKGIAVDAQRLLFKTQGDKDKNTSLTANPGDNFFTDTLDQALLGGAIDIAIHSAKDMPKDIPKGLSILALTQGLTDKDAWVSPYKLVDLPFGAKVGTSSVLRQTQILQLRPDLRIVDIRGTIGERLSLVKEGKIDGVIIAACALLRLGLKEEIKEILPWEGMALQGQLAVVGRANDLRLKNLFKVIDVRLSYGRVSLVGGGPGDPDLITLKAIKTLGQADCVLYDYLVDSGLLKYAPGAEHIFVGKRKSAHSMPQDELNRLIKQKAFEGKRTIRLKGGDPLIFGRGGEEIEYLRSYHIDVDVVPGVSSATGIASLLGIPLTARGHALSVAFVSAYEKGEEEKPKGVQIPKADTLVFLMGLTKLSQIVKNLLAENWPATTPILIVSKGATIHEKVLKGRLDTIEALIKENPLEAPALIIVGAVVNFYQEKRRKTYLHCGTHPELYGYLGKIIHHPLIDIKAVSFTPQQGNDLLAHWEKANIIICTSRYAVKSFMAVLLKVRPSLDLTKKTFVAIGRHTQKTLAEFHITPSIVSKEETAQGLFKAMKAGMDVKDKMILFPRSSIPNPFLKDALTKEGAKVEEVVVYENTPLHQGPLPQEGIDGIIFTAPSIVRNFIADYGKIPNLWEIIAKGPVTASELESLGYKQYSLEN